MLDFRKIKRYKIRKLYVCQISLATNKRISTVNDFFSDYTKSLKWDIVNKSIKILYSSQFNKKLTDPLTGKRYVLRNQLHFNENDELYVTKILGNVSDVCKIPDEIYSRGNYLICEEIIELNNQIKSEK